MNPICRNVTWRPKESEYFDHILQALFNPHIYLPMAKPKQNRSGNLINKYLTIISDDGGGRGGALT